MCPCVYVCDLLYTRIRSPPRVVLDFEERRRERGETLDVGFSGFLSSEFDWHKAKAAAERMQFLQLNTMFIKG